METDLRSKKVFIIAEAGVNHNGSIDLAKKLIDVASNSGADAVKFQTFKAQNLVTQKARKAKYQSKTTDKDKFQYTMLKKLELNEEMHRKLISYCKTKKIIFLSSPFDIDSIKLLNNLGLEKFKIPSGEITNLQYLSHIGKLNKKVILSTGMANIREVRDALNVLINSGTKKKNIIVLHANTEYPTPKEDVNLNAMVKMGKVFDISYGYSDHTLGIEVSIAATALGAVCIEKHFTLNRNMKGPDHKASLEPNELNSMVKSIRNIEIALGSDKKIPTKSERPNIKIVRKSLVAAKDIKRGEFFSEKNLTAKRPGNGKSPFLFKKLLGKRSQKNYKKDQQI